MQPQKLLELVDQMRLSVPRSVEEAQEVLEKREQIINQSMMDARRIKASAETDARNRVDESEVLREGQKRAEELIDQAQMKATRVLEQVEEEVINRRRGADEYAQEALRKLEEEVENVLGTVRRGLMVLDPNGQLASTSS